MPAIVIDRPSRRATIRFLSVAAAAVFVLANIAGGLFHTSASPALRDPTPKSRRSSSNRFATPATRAPPSPSSGTASHPLAGHRPGRRQRSTGRRADPIRHRLTLQGDHGRGRHAARRARPRRPRRPRDYLADFRLADDRVQEITVHQLLTHTSGIPTSAGTAPLSKGVTSLKAQVAALASVSLVSDPGAALAYSNANYLILGLLVERASGSDFARIAEHVFEPLGMTHAHVDLPDAKADGLTDAHRFWFGMPRAGEPLAPRPRARRLAHLQCR